MKSPIQRDIDRERSLYHYYAHKADLLSKCKAEIHKAQYEELKAQSRVISYQHRVQKFINQYPEYKGRFKNE